LAPLPPFKQGSPKFYRLPGKFPPIPEAPPNLERVTPLEGANKGNRVPTFLLLRPMRKKASKASALRHPRAPLLEVSKLSLSNFKGNGRSQYSH